MESSIAGCSYAKTHFQSSITINTYEYNDDH